MKETAFVTALLFAFVLSIAIACSGADGDPAPTLSEAGPESAASVPCVTATDGATE